MNRRMDKEGVVFTYNGVLPSQKEAQNVSFAEMWIDIETVIQSEVSQKEKNKYQIKYVMIKVCMHTCET